MATNKTDSINIWFELSRNVTSYMSIKSTDHQLKVMCIYRMGSKLDNMKVNWF